MDSHNVVVFVDSDCENDSEMQSVMKKIQSRMDRLMAKDKSVEMVPLGQAQSRSTTKMKQKKLNTRLKRLLKKKQAMEVEPSKDNVNYDPKPSSLDGDTSSVDSGMELKASGTCTKGPVKTDCENSGKDNPFKLTKHKRKLSPDQEAVVCKKERLEEGTNHADRNICDNSNRVIDQSKYVAMDCEFVGVGKKKLSALGRCSIVDYHGRILLDVYARPDQPITDYRTPWSGLRKRDLINAVPFESAVNQINRTLKGKIVVGHAVHNDFNVLGIHYPPDQIRDTCKSKILQTRCKAMGGHGSSLKTYAQLFLGRRIQKKEHCSVEDARATMDLYKHIAVEWENELKHAPTVENKLETQTKSQKKAVKKPPKRLKSGGPGRGAGCRGRAQTWRRLSEEEDHMSYLDDEYWPDMEYF